MKWTADLGKFAFACAVVTLAYAVTCTSSAETFSDFDTRTIAAGGGTVNAILLAGTLLILRRFRTAANALRGVVRRGGGVRLDDSSGRRSRGAALPLRRKGRARRAADLRDRHRRPSRCLAAGAGRPAAHADFAEFLHE